jgi:hypothetical protein
VTEAQRIAELELQVQAERRRADRLERSLQALVYRALYWRRADIGQSFLAGRFSAWGDIEQAARDAISWARGDRDDAPDGLA